eukprot:6118697-Pyramimonas_sp.AAC.1
MIGLVGPSWDRPVRAFSWKCTGRRFARSGCNSGGHKGNCHTGERGLTRVMEQTYWAPSEPCLEMSNALGLCGPSV